ncbi:MAG: HAMP domain-containing sensor histidine kinase [Solirubrobacteraceae bacterium]|nr:HAMP domain-containing sensor histidine kinase [Patulibacter sp.]
MKQLTLRARVTLAAAVVLAVSIGTVTIIANILLDRSLDRDAAVVLTARAEALRAAIDVGPGDAITVENRPNDSRLGGRAWVYDAAGKVVSAPQNGGTVGPEAGKLAGVTKPTERLLDDGPTRLRAIPVYGPDGKTPAATVVVALTLRPYDFNKRRSLIESVVLALLVLIIGSLIAWRAVGAALAPVASMARDAEEWSEHDLERRFERGPARDELGSLATTLDGLLGRIAASRRQEQRFSAEMAHELRTPLAAMRGETELLARRADDPDAVRAGLADVLRHTDRMASVIDTLMGVARDELDAAAGTGDAGVAARSVAHGVSAAAAARHISVDVDVASDLPLVGAPGDLVERALHPLLDNAVKHARTSVALRVAAEGSEVRFTVDDDGPGVDPEIAENVFEPGVRGHDSAGVGLGLALSRRLALTCEGDVAVEPSASGARFVLRLPALG